MQLSKKFQAFKNLESKNNFIQEVLEKSVSNFLEEIEMRSTMCGMHTKKTYIIQKYTRRKKEFLRNIRSLEIF